MATELFSRATWILDLLEADELGEFRLGLDEQVGLALLGAGVDEVGLGRVRSRDPTGRCGRRCAPRWWSTMPNDVSDSASSTSACLGVGGVQVLQHLGGLEVLALRPQRQRLGQRAVDGGDRDGARRVLEIGQRGREHAEAGQRDAERDTCGMRVGLVEIERR